MIPVGPVRIHILKFIAEHKSLQLHQITDRTVHRISGLIVLDPRRRLRVQVHLLPLRPGKLRICNIPAVIHVPEDLLSPCQCMLFMLQRIIIGRRIGNRTQVGRLPKTQLRRRFAEIFFRCRLYPIAAVGKIRTVYIIFQNLLLRIFFLQLHCQQDLPNLALQRHLAGQKGAPGKLLGDGAGAVFFLSLCDHKTVADPQNPVWVIALMLPEIPVLHRDESLNHRLRNLLIRQIVRITVDGQLADEVSVRVIDVTAQIFHEDVRTGFRHHPDRLRPVFLIDRAVPVIQIPAQQRTG